MLPRRHAHSGITGRSGLNALLLAEEERGHTSVLATMESLVMWDAEERSYNKEVAMFK